MNKTTEHIIHVTGLIDPEIISGFKNQDEVDAKVKTLIQENGDADAYFQLTIDGKGKPHIYTFSNAFFDEAMDEE